MSLQEVYKVLSDNYLKSHQLDSTLRELATVQNKNRTQLQEYKSGRGHLPDQVRHKEMQLLEMSIENNEKAMSETHEKIEGLQEQRKTVEQYMTEKLPQMFERIRKYECLQAK